MCSCIDVYPCFCVIYITVYILPTHTQFVLIKTGKVRLASIAYKILESAVVIVVVVCACAKTHTHTREWPNKTAATPCVLLGANCLRGACVRMQKVIYVGNVCVGMCHVCVCVSGISAGKHTKWDVLRWLCVCRQRGNRLPRVCRDRKNALETDGRHPGM